MNRALYALHRWISIGILLQFAIWLCSGLFFASFPIEAVHGEHVGMPMPLRIDDGAGLISAATAIGVATASGFGPVEGLELHAGPTGPVYFVRGPRRASLRLDARTGGILRVGRDEAEAIARHDQRDAPQVVDAALIERDAPIEYRDRPLPAWRVLLADRAGTAVWIDGQTGEVTARRNDLWRQYDFLWSLHIMDYRGRETFHHPLLIVAAGLGLCTVVSGAALWVLRFMRWRRRRATAA